MISIPVKLPLNSDHLMELLSYCFKSTEMEELQESTAFYRLELPPSFHKKALKA
jgi:hypothetical protein